MFIAMHRTLIYVELAAKARNIADAFTVMVEEAIV
jgi:hypothetical protein